MSEILTEVRQYLNITWDDWALDKKLNGFIERGKAGRQKNGGAPRDLRDEELPQARGLDYCRYAYSQALEVFEVNFEAELISLRYDYGGVASGDQNADEV